MSRVKTADERRRKNGVLPAMTSPKNNNLLTGDVLGSSRNTATSSADQCNNLASVVSLAHRSCAPHDYIANINVDDDSVWVDKHGRSGRTNDRNCLPHGCVGTAPLRFQTPQQPTQRRLAEPNFVGGMLPSYDYHENVGDEGGRYGLVMTSPMIENDVIQHHLLYAPNGDMLTQLLSSHHAESDSLTDSGRGQSVDSEIATHHSSTGLGGVNRMSPLHTNSGFPLVPTSRDHGTESNVDMPFPDPPADMLSDVVTTASTSGSYRGSRQRQKNL
jgi:hypothetical protein